MNRATVRHNDTDNLAIPRPIEVVRGYRAIARRMHVGIETVRLWSSLGAPIRFDRQTPLAEVAELWAWSSRGNGLATTPAWPV